MDVPYITDPFFRQLYKRLAEKAEERTIALAEGSALIRNTDGTLDMNAIALKYQESVAYIRALGDVITVGTEIDHGIHGNRGNDFVK